MWRVGVLVFFAALTQVSSLGLGTPVQAAVLRVPEEYATIQLAVDAAGVTDTVSIAPGTYTGAGNRDVEVANRSVVIRSRSGPDQTVIDCQNAGRAFSLYGSGSTPTIEGLTIQNGHAWDSFPVGGAVRSQLAHPSFRNCHFVENEAYAGGAVFVSTVASFTDCSFVGNFGDSWDGGGAVWTLMGGATFRNCMFAGNYTSGLGGAIRHDSGDMLLVDCTLTRNLTMDTGGAIFSVGSAVTMERSISWGNCPNEIEKLTGPLALYCSDVDLSGVVADEVVIEDVIDADPVFCDPRPCAWGYLVGDYTLRSDSPCLPDGNPCGVQIGALGMGCLVPGVGACCLSDGSCTIDSPAGCASQQGIYLGDGIECLPDPCAATPIVPSTWGRIKAAYR